MRKLSNELDKLRESITSVKLDDNYIPNSNNHQQIWTENPIKNAFTPIISEDIVKDIMEVDVEDSMKILLLLGIIIGTIVFRNVNSLKLLYPSEFSIISFSCCDLYI